MEEKLYSFGELHKQYKIYPNLIEYLNIEVIKKGRISYVNQESFDKLMAFKSEHPNTREFFQKLTFMKKYGTDNPMKVKDIRDKAKQTILDKFGVKNVSQSKEIKEKKIETLQSHFGEDVTNPMHIQEVVDKVKENWENKTQEEIDSYTVKTKVTKKELYGNENYNNAESISQTKLARTQEEINDEVRKVKATKKEKYGDENYNNREQIRKTCESKYGKDNIFKTDNFIHSQKNKKLKSKEEYKSKGKYLLTDVAKIINRDYSTLKFEIIPKLNIELIEETIINGNNKYLITENDFTLIKDYCSKTEHNGISYGEKEIVEFLKSIYDGEIIENCRTVISPKELDIYIPNKNLAIEFDGIYWHSEQHLLCNGITDSYELEKIKNLALIKTELCEKLGIRLIHILDIDWIENKEIYKSMISSALGIYSKKIMARDCIFKIIDNKIAYDFLDINHIQHHAKCTKSYGLYYNSELVQVMTFQKQSNHNLNECELNRMATKLNTQVIGGFSKLLKNAISDLNVSEITSYVDRSIFSGTSYTSIGFNVVKINPPTYKWYYKGKLYRREFSMKKNQKIRFKNNEQKYFDESKTEVQNMINNKIPRIWNCGTIKVIYYK